MRQKPSKEDEERKKSILTAFKEHSFCAWTLVFAQNYSFNPHSNLMK